MCNGQRFLVVDTCDIISKIDKLAEKLMISFILIRYICFHRVHSFELHEDTL